MPNKFILDQGVLREKLNNNIMAGMNQLKGSFIEKGVRKALKPQIDLAQKYYTNLVEEAAAFVNQSESTNSAGGLHTYDVLSPSSNLVRATSLVPWQPLSEEYAERKVRELGSKYKWSYTGALAANMSAAVSKARVTMEVASYKWEPVFRRLGTFEYILSFSSLGSDILDKTLVESFVNNEAVDPSKARHYDDFDEGRQGLSYLVFLERYAPRRSGQRGGPGRPMLSAIGKALGADFRQAFEPLRFPRA